MCIKYTNKKKNKDSAICNLSLLLPAARLAIKHVNGKDFNTFYSSYFNTFRSAPISHYAPNWAVQSCIFYLHRRDCDALSRKYECINDEREYWRCCMFLSVYVPLSNINVKYNCILRCVVSCWNMEWISTLNVVTCIVARFCLILLYRSIY